MKKLLQGLSIKHLLSFLLMQVIAITAFNQQIKYHAKDDLNLLVSGTSTMHDWTMKDSKGDVNAVFTFSTSGQITALNSLGVVIPSNGIKSEHGAMDKKAYKSLKTDASPNIIFTLVSSTVTPVDASSYTISCKGKLSIAGVINDVDLTATCKVNADKSITVNGKKKISMKDYKMESPSWLFVKTGDEITLTFDLIIRK